MTPDPNELMPDDVAAAIERCKAHVIGRKVTGMQKELTAAIEILIRAASTRASHPREVVEEVTVEELAELLYIEVDERFTHDMGIIALQYPQGIKIKAGGV